MKKIKFRVYNDLKKVNEIKVKEFIINLEECPINKRARFIDFFGGLTFLNGSIKKLNTCEYVIKIG